MPPCPHRAHLQLQQASGYRPSRASLLRSPGLLLWPGRGWHPILQGGLSRCLQQAPRESKVHTLTGRAAGSSPRQACLSAWGTKGQDRGSAAAAACVGTNFLAPPPSWRQQLRPDKEEGRGRPGSSFSLAVPHFEADSGNLAPHLQERMAHLFPQAQDKQDGDGAGASL